MVRYIYLRGTLRNTTLSIAEGIISLSYDRMKKLSLLRLLLAKLKKNDVIIHDDLGWDALLLILFKTLKRYKVVIRLRGDAFEVLRNGPHIWTYFPRKLLTWFILRSADYILFNSLQLHGRKEYSFASSHSGIAYNPLMIQEDFDHNKNENNKNSGFRLLTVTNFHFPQKIKPLTNALQSWVTPDFLEKHDIQWDIIGSGHYHEKFKKDIQAERFKGRVTVHGYRDDVHDFYKSHHLCIYLSGFDAFPNVVLEASYFGLPIITNPESCGTLEAIIDGETGVILNNAQTFQDTILAYYNNKELRKKHGLAAHDFVTENFSIEKQKIRAEKLLRCYFEAVSQDVEASKTVGTDKDHKDDS